MVSQGGLLQPGRLAPGRPPDLLPAHRGRLRQRPHGGRGQQPDHLRLPADRPDQQHQRDVPVRPAQHGPRARPPAQTSASCGSRPTSRGRRSAGTTRSPATPSAGSGEAAGPGPTSSFWKAYPDVESELLNIHGLNHKIDFVADYRDAYSNVPLNSLGVQDDLDDNTYEYTRPLLRPDQLHRRDPPAPVRPEAS